MFAVPEKYRVAKGKMASDIQDGNNGLFEIRSVKFKRCFTCLASDGLGWEHVSVSLPDRCPTWEEMEYIKGKFWAEDDCVIQFHPPKKDYINCHPYCLHLWRPMYQVLPRPPKFLVG